MRGQRWFLSIIISSWLLLPGVGAPLYAQTEPAGPSALTRLTTLPALTVQQGADVWLKTRLSAGNQPLAAQRVRLTLPAGQLQEVQTDEAGVAHFRLSTAQLAVGQHGLSLVFPGTPALRPAISVLRLVITPPLALPTAPTVPAHPAWVDATVVQESTGLRKQPHSAALPDSSFPLMPYVPLLPIGLAIVLTMGTFTTIAVKGVNGNPRRGQPQPELTVPQRSRRRLRWVISQHLWSVKGSLALATVAILGNTAMDLLGPWPLKIIFDHILLKQPMPAQLALLADWVGGRPDYLLALFAGLLALIAILGAGFSYLETFVTSRIGFQLVTTLRRELFAHLQRLPLSFYQQNQRGEVLTKVSSDTQTLRDVFTETGLTLITNGLTVIGMFMVMLYVNWQLALAPLLSMPLILLICARIQDKVTASTRSQRKKEGKITAQLAENLAIMPVVQAFGRERYEVERFNDVNDQNLAEGIQVARLSAAMTRTITAISAFCLAVVVSYGGWLALHGIMTPGDVLLFVTYVKGMYKPLREVVKLSSKLTKGVVSAQRIAEILDIEPEVQDKPDALVAPRLRGEIRFRHVTFGYSDERQTLHDLSFDIPSGRRVAIVGSSGAGKSTILNLLLRLYDPQQGEILIDGVDLRDYQRESYRSQLGLVLQDSLLFGATIRENIAYGRPQATLEEIETAARQAYIHDFIVGLPQGYHTVLSEQGSTLSGGQRQRIAIARALVKQPSILVLDEPTSALDAESRAMVQQTMQRIAKGKTMLVIAHQLSTIQDFDEILVMHKGRIVERGSHYDLLQRRGYYAQLQRLQGADQPAPGGNELATTPLLPALQPA